MTNPQIYLALVDDWELSGNGSGDIRELQFEPMLHLLTIYKRLGIRGSFNAEVMQQLTFRQYQEMHPELKELANDWDNAVSDAFLQGHDIQLHVHPQWHNAQYKNGKWKLTSDWSILNYSYETAFDMLERSKNYLERLLGRVDRNYRCVSFRAGAWCIAPSPYMLEILVKLGIVFDISIVAGVRYKTRNINLDYTACEEAFLPYYPVMTDARRVSNKSEPIVCVPTNCFHVSRRQVFLHHLEKLVRSLSRRIAPQVFEHINSRSVETYGAEWSEIDTTTIKRIYQKGIVPYLKGKHMISDLAQLDYPLLSEMLASICERAKATKLTDVPIVLENHSKDVRDFSDIERFLEEAANSPDIRFVTLTDLAKQLCEGRLKIKTKRLD